MSEDEFWRLTPAQFERKLKAEHERRRQVLELEQARQEAEQRRAAWIVTTIMNFAGKQLPKGRKVGIEDVLKARKTAKDIQAARRQLVQRHRLGKRFGITC